MKDYQEEINKRIYELGRASALADVEKMLKEFWNLKTLTFLEQLPEDDYDYLMLKMREFKEALKSLQEQKWAM